MSVFVDETAEDFRPLDSSGAAATNVDVCDARQLFQGLMRPMRVVVVLVLGQHVNELSLAEDQHPVQALMTDRAHPAFGVGVGLR